LWCPSFCCEPGRSPPPHVRPFFFPSMASFTDNFFFHEDPWAGPLVFDSPDMIPMKTLKTLPSDLPLGNTSGFFEVYASFHRPPAPAGDFFLLPPRVQHLVGSAKLFPLLTGRFFPKAPPRLQRPTFLPTRPRICYAHLLDQAGKHNGPFFLPSFVRSGDLSHISLFSVT